jgi:hypothetical protein
MCPDELPFAQGELAPEDFQAPGCRGLAEALWKGSVATEASSDDAVLARDLIAKASDHDADYRWDVAVRVSTLGMVVRLLHQRQRDLLRQAATPESVAEMERVEGAVAARKQLIGDLLKQVTVESEDPMPYIRSIVAKYTGQSEPGQETD